MEKLLLINIILRQQEHGTGAKVMSSYESRHTVCRRALFASHASSIIVLVHSFSFCPFVDTAFNRIPTLPIMHTYISDVLYIIL